MQAMEDLKDLRRRTRNPQFKSLEIEEYRQAQLAEVQDNKDRRIALRWTCNCKGQLKAVKCLGKTTESTPSSPQDWAICPDCGTRLGKTSKERVPNKYDYRDAAKLPDEQCNRCGKFGATVKDLPVTIGVLEFPVYRCVACKALPWQGKATAKVPLPAPPADDDRRRRTPPPPSPRRPSPRQRQPRRHYPRTEEPTEAPPGSQRTMWTGPLPGERAKHEDLTPMAIGHRMADLLKEHGHTHCFTTMQLRTVGTGVRMDAQAPKELRQRTNHGYEKGKKILRDAGLEIVVHRVPGGWHRIYWTRPAKKPKHKGASPRSGAPIHCVPRLPELRDGITCPFRCLGRVGACHHLPRPLLTDELPVHAAAVQDALQVVDVATFGRQPASSDGLEHEGDAGVSDVCREVAGLDVRNPPPQHLRRVGQYVEDATGRENVDAQWTVNHLPIAQAVNKLRAQELLGLLVLQPGIVLVKIHCQLTELLDRLHHDVDILGGILDALHRHAAPPEVRPFAGER